MTATALVTGGAGFVGTNLADRLAQDGCRVLVLDDLSRPGVEENLRRLTERHPGIEAIVGDVADREVLGPAVAEADSVFHLAGQVAVTTSLSDPLADARANLWGTLAVLEAVRERGRRVPVLFTSTNKVYGGLADLGLMRDGDRYVPRDPDVAARGIGEARGLSFCTPYGCSKGAADQYVCDYASSFGLPTVVFRMSCIYGPHQFGTEDQGWVAHFLISALHRQPVTIFGDGRQVRDILFVTDLVEAMVRASARATEFAGTAFNIGGGPAHAVTLREVLRLIEDELGAPVALNRGAWRPGDQRYYVSDHTRFTDATGWRPTVAPAEGLRRMRAWLDERAPTRAAA